MTRVVTSHGTVFPEISGLPRRFAPRNDEISLRLRLADDIISIINLNTKTIALSAVLGRDVTIDAKTMGYSTVAESNYLMMSHGALSLRGAKRRGNPVWFTMTEI